MKHLAQRLFSKNSLLGTGLALALGLLVTAAPASAQRRGSSQGDSRATIHVGSQWELGVQKNTKRGSAALRVGSRGVSIDLASNRRPRVPRGFDGGRYEYRSERFWVPGYDRQVWVAPVYEWRYDSCGRRIQVLVCAGHYRTVCVPGRYDTRQVKVWVPARRAIDVGCRGRDQRFDNRRRSTSSIRAHRVTHRR